jgi:hypothetical protein
MPATKAKAVKDQVVSASEMARHLDVSREALRRLVASGEIEQRDDGRFDLDATRRAYIRSRSSKPARSLKLDKLREEQTKLTRLRIARESFDMVPRSESEQATDNVSYAVVSGLPLFLAHLLYAIGARTDRDSWVILEGFGRRFRHYVYARVLAEAEALETTGKADPRTAEQFAAAFEDEWPEAGGWIPPRPEPGPRSGLDHPNSYLNMDWRVKALLAMVPYLDDSEIARLATHPTAHNDLTTVTAARVAKLRAEEVAKVTAMQQAIDAA